MSQEKTSLSAKFIYSLTKVYVLLRSLCYKLIGKSTLGVRAIVISNERKVLLVKHTYQPGWYLPGGAVKRGESLSDAITRELNEEAGVQLYSPPKLFSIYLAPVHGAFDYPAVFIVTHYQQSPRKSLEIAQIKWFAVNELPQDTTPATRRRLLEFFEEKPVETAW